METETQKGHHDMTMRSSGFRVIQGLRGISFFSSALPAIAAVFGAPEKNGEMRLSIFDGI